MHQVNRYEEFSWTQVAGNCHFTHTNTFDAGEPYTGGPLPTRKCPGPGGSPKVGQGHAGPARRHILSVAGKSCRGETRWVMERGMDITPLIPLLFPILSTG